MPKLYLIGAWKDMPPSFTKPQKADSGLRFRLLPGWYSQGDTIDELMENVREAITGVLEVMREQGRQPEANIQILDVAV
jgi:hypothetical protein